MTLGLSKRHRRKPLEIEEAFTFVSAACSMCRCCASANRLQLIVNSLSYIMPSHRMYLTNCLKGLLTATSSGCSLSVHPAGMRITRMRFFRQTSSTAGCKWALNLSSSRTIGVTNDRLSRLMTSRRQGMTTLSIHCLISSAVM